MSHNFILSALALTLTVASCGQPKDVEVGPYTVSVIENNVWHIQDYNKANPAGESFDAEGNKTHFNNCSDIYLLVGEEEALVIDLSNPIDWADDAAESLRDIIFERAAGKPVTITFTHNHGDHTGMIPAFTNNPDVRFALPEEDFYDLADRFPEAQRILTGAVHLNCTIPEHFQTDILFQKYHLLQSWPR